MQSKQTETQEKKKIRKSRSEDKVEGSRSASLFPARKREAVSHPGWNHGARGIDRLTWMRTQRAAIVLFYVNVSAMHKRDRGDIAGKARITRARAS